jgi:hypothetical protein
MKIKLAALIATSWALAGALVCSAQQSLFQTSDGDSSIFLSGGVGVASYNFGSSTARFDLARDPGSMGNRHDLTAWGVGAGGTVKSGSASWLNNNSPAPGGFAEGAWFLKQLKAKNAGDGIEQCANLLNPKNAGPASVQSQCGKNGQSPKARGGLVADELVFQFHYERTQFYLLSSATTPTPPPTKTNFDQFRSTVAYNQTYTAPLIDIRLGLAYTPGTQNNLSQLTQETYQSQSITSTSSGQTILSPPSKTVYVGNYQAFFSHPVNFDAVFQPKALNYYVGFDLLERSELGGGSSNRYVSPGIGMFFFKKGSPIVPVGGVTYSYKQGKSNISIGAGWSFGGTQSGGPANAKAPAAGAAGPN